MTYPHQGVQQGDLWASIWLSQLVVSLPHSTSVLFLQLSSPTAKMINYSVEDNRQSQNMPLSQFVKLWNIVIWSDIYRLGTKSCMNTDSPSPEGTLWTPVSEQLRQQHTPTEGIQITWDCSEGVVIVSLRHKNESLLNLARDYWCGNIRCRNIPPPLLPQRDRIWYYAK
jgi:hypothetical protein